MRGYVALACAVALSTGCASVSQVGPYVKHVARNGDWLVIHKCVLVLESEAGCTVEQIPLASLQQLPAQPAPQPLPPR